MAEERTREKRSMRDEIECELIRVKHYMHFIISIKSINNQCVCHSIHQQKFSPILLRGQTIGSNQISTRLLAVVRRGERKRMKILGGNTVV